MSVKTETIATIFAAWLKRYSPPNVMKNDADVMKAERDSLLRVLLKFAPDRDYDGWCNRVLDRLEYQMKTRAWPTKGELGSVCSNLRKEQGGAGGPEWSLEPSAIAARRMNAGEVVGDEWIYGRRCVEVMETGEVSQDTLRAYRSGYFFALKKSLGDGEAARKIEAQMIAKHDAAEASYRQGVSGPRFKAPAYKPKGFPQSSLDENGNVVAAE